jgi:hypothetical protein
MSGSSACAFAITIDGMCDDCWYRRESTDLTARFFLDGFPVHAAGTVTKHTSDFPSETSDFWGMMTLLQSGTLWASTLLLWHMYTGSTLRLLQWLALRIGIFWWSTNIIFLPYFISQRNRPKKSLPKWQACRGKLSTTINGYTNILWPNWNLTETLPKNCPSQNEDTVSSLPHSEQKQMDQRYTFFSMPQQTAMLTLSQCPTTWTIAPHWQTHNLNRWITI